MEIACVFCQQTNPKDAHFCQSCENSLIVGKLTSNGMGILSKGFTWEIRPCDHTLGKDMVNDFVIPGTRIANRHATFVYGNDCFYLRDESGQGNVLMNGSPISGPTPLPGNCVITVGKEEFRYSFSLPEGAVANRALRTQGGSLVHPPASENEHEQAQVTNQLQLLLGIVSGINGAGSMQAALEQAVDAVLRITQTSRGYCFMIEQSHDGTAEMREMTARQSGQKPLADTGNEYTISQSLLAEVLAGNGSIMIEDAMTQQINTNTIRRFKLKTIVCLPLMDASGKHVCGVIYADDVMPTAPLPDYARNSLLMLMEILSETIAKWQQFDATARQSLEARTRLQNVKEPLDGIIADLQEIRDMMSGLNGPLNMTWSIEKTLKKAQQLNDDIATMG